MDIAKFDISVIIPCYNTNIFFIQEAIDSVKKSHGKFSYAIIIVDDGSTDLATVDFLKNINNDSLCVICQPNQGPAAARNTGVRNADSEYILFLDSDDRVLPGYIQEGINRLKKNLKAGVVYSNAVAFGDASRTSFSAKPFNILDLLIQNFIPMCAVMRKKTWEDVSGIDEKLIQYEDWEFWIRIYKAGWQFIYIDKPMFEYRIQRKSLIAQAPEENFKKAVDYIFKKHIDLVYKCYHELYARSLMYKNDMNKPLRSFIKFSKKKYLN